VGAHPEDVVDLLAALVEAAVEHVRAQLLGVADDANHLVKVALVVAIEARRRCGREGFEGITTRHALRL
jgi:hypothetical protein